MRYDSNRKQVGRKYEADKTHNKVRLVKSESWVGPNTDDNRFMRERGRG